MSSKIVRVSSRLCGEISRSSLDDVAHGKLGEVGITTTEQIAWRPVDNRRLHRVRRVVGGKIEEMWSARQLVALPCHKQRLRGLKKGELLDAEDK